MIVSGIACAGVACGLSLLRSVAHQAVVQIRIGAISPLGFVEQPNEVARRLSSRSGLFALAGLTEAEVAAKAGVDPSALRNVLRLDGSVLTGGRLVKLTVVAPNPGLADLLTRKAAAGLSAEHQKIYEDAKRENVARIQQLEELLVQMQKGLEQTPSAVAGEPPIDHDRWTALASLAKDVSALKEANLPPKAFTTQIITGPDAAPVRKNPSAPLAAILGLLCGSILAAGLVIAASAAAPYLDSPSGAGREG